MRWQLEGRVRQETGNEARIQKENEVYGMVQQEMSEQYREEIRQAVAAYRLKGGLRANHGGRYRLVGDTKWEFERYAGLMKKRLSNLV